MQRLAKVRARQEFDLTATLLFDGRVLLAGGVTFGGEILAVSELYLSR